MAIFKAQSWANQMLSVGRLYHSSGGQRPNQGENCMGGPWQKMSADGRSTRLSGLDYIYSAWIKPKVKPGGHLIKGCHTERGVRRSL